MFYEYEMSHSYPRSFLMHYEVHAQNADQVGIVKAFPEKRIMTAWQ